MIPRIFDCSHQQVIGLSSFEMGVFINREIALLGGSLMPCPQEQTISTPKPDEILYSVSGFYFSDRDEAYRFCEYIKSKYDFLYEIDRDYKNDCMIINGKLCNKGYGLPEVDEVHAYSKETYRLLEEDLKLSVKAKKEFKREMAEWDKNKGIVRGCLALKLDS